MPTTHRPSVATWIVKVYPVVTQAGSQTMKMGIKEFRERLGEIGRGNETIELTDRGRKVGTYIPEARFDRQKALEAALSIRRWQDDLRGKGIEPEDWLSDMGLDPWGVPLDRPHDR